MKHFIKALLGLMILSNFSLYAQNSQGEKQLYIGCLLPERENIPNEAANQLRNKMEQLLAQNGIADDDPLCRFLLTAKADIVTKDIIAGPPAKTSMNIDFTFIVGDAEDNKVFESTTISTTGVGINETKAFIAAIKNIKPKSPDLVSFLNKSKEKIVAYYQAKCKDIMAKAEQAASERDYGQSVYLLMQIPDVCEQADECKQRAIAYSLEYTENHAAELLNQAKSLWAASPNAKGASDAADVIASIPANTSSQPQLDKLVKEINNKLRADEKKAWDFKIKQYNDKIEKQKHDDQARLEQQRADNTYRAEQQRADNAYRKEQQSADNKARTQSIEAARQVGLEYARNQPKSVTVNYQENVILW